MTPAEQRKSRLLELADFIEKLDEARFDMDDYGPLEQSYDDAQKNKAIKSMECGAPVCIAGWTCFIWKELFNPLKSVMSNAQSILNLTSLEAANLFCPGYWLKDFDPSKKEDAVRLLRALANGEVNLNYDI